MKIFWIYIMTTKVAIHQIKAALDFPHKILDFINYAKTIQESMAGSNYFTSLATEIAALLTAITTLDSRESGSKAVPPTFTIAQRDAAWVIVQSLLRDMQGAVQLLAKADMPNAESIIKAAGMHVKGIGIRGKSEFRVEFGGQTGSVKLSAPGIPGTHGAHEWGWSADGTNWTSITSTVDASTIAEGFTLGQVLDFRHRTITNDGPSAWDHVDDYAIQ